MLFKKSIKTETKTIEEPIQHCGYLQDASGDKSSKRLFGSILIGSGILMSWILFIISIKNPMPAYETAKSIIEISIGLGSALLGIGVTEKFFDRRNKA